MAKPSVPIDGVFAPKKKPKDDRIWQEKVRDFGNEWADYFLGPHRQSVEGLASLLPAQAIPDALQGSGEVSSGVKNQNPWEAGMGLIDMLTAGLPGPDISQAALLTGFLPKRSKATEFDLIHGTRHDFAPTPNNELGEFDLSKVLSGEGTNYEGKGIYATDTKAEGLAKSYAHTNIDYTPRISIGGVNLNEKIKKLDDEILSVNELLSDVDFVNHDPIHYTQLQNRREHLVDTENTLSHFVRDLVNKQAAINRDPSKVKDILGSWLDYGKVKNNKDLTELLTSLSGPVDIREPGGFIYDFKVHDSPDNFINMHLPLQYQDDKIIKGVDEWFKNMPVSEKQLRDFMPIDGIKTPQKYRDYQRKKFIDDEYKIPKEDMSRILQNEFLNEHMDILKDQGILGQKWFGRHGPGSQYRDDVHQLFQDLAAIDNATSEGTDGISMTRDVLMNKINQLELKIETMPLTDKNMDKIMGMQSTVNELNMRLMNMVGPDDIAEKLYKRYNDPNLAYNYTINDPKKTTITGKKFKPY